jgi:hypothetical protein
MAFLIGIFSLGSGLGRSNIASNTQLKLRISEGKVKQERYQPT